MPVNLFDANYYRSVNNLAGLTDSAALSNFQTVGLSNGLNFSPLVDLSYSRASNSDLAGLTNQQLYDYLSNTGIAEGRKFSPVFDLKYYRDNNADLAGLSNEQLFNQYASTGLREGRNASPFITTDKVSDRLKSATSIAVASTPVIFRESVGDNDLGDVYKFQLDSQSTSVNLVLNGLSANANLELLDSQGRVLTSSTSAGNTSESISYNNLPSSTYYIRVYQAAIGQDTNYNLSVSSKLLSNEADVSNSQQFIPVAQTPVVEPATPSNSFLDQVLQLVNAQRANANTGLKPLVLDDKLSQVAYSHSKDMASNDYFSHTGADGSSAQDRVNRAGISFKYAGENIAAGYVTPQEVVDAWMSSPGHRANILNPNYSNMGVGYFHLDNDTGNVNYFDYWTQDFSG